MLQMIECLVKLACCSIGVVLHVREDDGKDSTHLWRSTFDLFSVSASVIQAWSRQFRSGYATRWNRNFNMRFRKLASNTD
jgi:hypothetical protein